MPKECTVIFRPSAVDAGAELAPLGQAMLGEILDLQAAMGCIARDQEAANKALRNLQRHARLLLGSSPEAKIAAGNRRAAIDSLHGMFDMLNKQVIGADHAAADFSAATEEDLRKTLTGMDLLACRLRKCLITKIEARNPNAVGRII